ncbi:MAG: hypothetical protein KDJ45_08255 [Hyphomicrobiaceae bacterium]|nr:hypothetical protein [Hyphomicrobiaceae bacterium]MCC0010878.1 hypothetical protein [Hyphomicrobiaceae bacterium]
MTKKSNTPMRYELRQELDRAIRVRRLRMAAIAIAVLGLVASGFALIDVESHETRIRLGGTIDDVHNFAGKGAMDGLEVGVKLEDGRHIRVLSLKSRHPQVGDLIEITEHRHPSGRTVFTLR